MDVLLGVDFAVAEKDRLYRCLDRILKHKRDLFVHLQQRWKNLFAVSFDVLLYDLTSTYVEGEAEQNPKAKRGYSRDGRPDCKPVIVALVITPEGFPLAYEVMDGNTSDKTTLRGFLARIEELYGKARREHLFHRNDAIHKRTVAVDAVSISEEIPGRILIGEGLDDLLGRPSRRGMLRHIAMQHLATAMFQHDKRTAPSS